MRSSSRSRGPRRLGRRRWLASAGSGLLAVLAPTPLARLLADETAPRRGRELRITALRVTPVALPDPPILAASGCHGPYFLRNLVEIETDAGICGSGETHGGERVTTALEASRALLAGQSVFAYRKLTPSASRLSASAYAGIELACLDAIGRATGLRLCELLGGPVRERVEFAAYLFFRFAADDPRLLADPRLADGRGRGDKALDGWGEVRTPHAMAELAWRFHQRWGFRCQKLKAGVLPPDVEVEALRAINERCGGKHRLRIDPNCRWSLETALRIGERLRDLPLEYYEDPVSGQEAMAEVRRRSGLKTSTNSCVTSFPHIPRALETKPIDVVLCDHHYWGGIPACQALGQLCEAFGWGLSQHSNNHAGVTLAAMAHLAACVPQLTYASDTHYPWLVEGADIIAGANLSFRDGSLDLPSGPGLGVEIDRDKASRAHEVYTKCGMRERDDAYTMRLVEPGWERTPY
jgi:glucarate dehydratase